MVERKYIKVRTDMYSDTKFKIIDTMEERDLIHYIWTRLLTLAGKVNLEGALYMSRNIPYTLETLAIEFNRSISKVKLALEAFKDLEMIELGENNVYKVKNFAKHQNIKSKKNVEKSDDEKKSNDKINSEKLSNEKNSEDKNKGDYDITSNIFNEKNCKLEVNDDKNFINYKYQKDNVNFEERYKKSEKLNTNLSNDKVNEQVKNEDYKLKEIKDFENNENEICKDDEICKDFNERTVFKDSESTIFKDDEDTINEDNERAICKDNNLYIKNEKENKAELEDTMLKAQNKNLCKNKSKNDKCKVKEFKSISKKESFINNDINRDNIEIEKNSIPLNHDKEFLKKESREIDFNVNLTCNNKKKKAKKSKKKSEDIEELCFEELLSEEDVIKPIEWKDEPILQGEIIKEFSF